MKLSKWFAILFLFSVLFANFCYSDKDTSGSTRAGIYLPMGFGGQYTPNAWGFDIHTGLGIRVYYVGIGAETHYLFNWGSVPGIYSSSAKEALGLARLDIYPFRSLKVSALGGAAYYFPDQSGSGITTRAVGGLRLALEGHVSPNFSMEPAFSVLQTFGPQPFQTYLFTASFSLWNEALASALLIGVIRSVFRR